MSHNINFYKQFSLFTYPGCYREKLKSELPYDMPSDAFDYPADAWLNARAGTIDPDHYMNAKPITGLAPIAWAVFYDFHSLMNREIIYIHSPSFVFEEQFTQNKIPEAELQEIDSLAGLLQHPDDNFAELQRIWETNKKYRLLGGGLLP